MRRKNSRVLRYHAEMNPIAEYDSAYIGKHENIIDSIAEIFDEVCSALRITAEYIAELTAHDREIAEKVTERIRRRIDRMFPAPALKFHGGNFPGKKVMPYVGIV